jgi:hypothetical protein
MRARLAFFAVSLLALAACGTKSQKSGPPENKTAAVDALEDPKHPGLEACRGSISSGDLESNLEIARATRESYHEMVVCGGLNASISITLIQIMISSAAGKDTNPSGFTFNGTGMWSAGTQMDVSFHLGFDTKFGKAGDLITYNLFKLDTFFTGATIKATASVNTSGQTTTSLSMAFTGLGPGIELLGLGPEPKSPIVIDAGKIAESLGKIVLKSKIHIDDKKVNSHIKYELETLPMTLGQITAGEPTVNKLLNVSGERPDVGQKMTVTTFGIDYRDIGSGYLDGKIEVDITGGPFFPYSVTYTYPRRNAPDVALSCEVGKKPAFDAGVTDTAPADTGVSDSAPADARPD